MRNFLVVVTLLALVSCSVFKKEQFYGYMSHGQRAPASNVDLSRLEVLLAVDKFDYYIGEYLNAYGKHIDETSVLKLKAISIQDILAKYSDDARIQDALKYDDIIWDIVKEGRSSMPHPKSKYQWGYNFFKKKLNGGFVLMDTRLKTTDQSAITNLKPEIFETLADTPYDPKELTLEADQYISNRTTRAVFWEAVESGRDVEFHLENSREFLKNLSQNGAEVIKEVRPFANNYNKIYVVQYPGEVNYRYAITSIGGEDRLKHLTLQFGLSKLNNEEITNKVRIFGSVEKSQKVMEDELTGIFKHMPKADRVMIGQKGAIERTIGIMWKIRALKNLYEEDPESVLSKVVEKRRDDLKALFATEDFRKFDIFKNKKEIETAFNDLESIIEERGLTPKDFKQYDYDNFVISMSDFVFRNKDNKEVVWRVVANSWGDEIAPLAKALKNSGHRHITYIGTAGAFPDKGYKVGDLVIPSQARYKGSKTELKGTALDIPGAKVGGVVDHVFSPFVETEAWLAESSQNADFVEVETGYLRQVFNTDDFDFKAYLLISDILTNEGETLATASSAKRRNALNKLLYGIMDRDNMGIPREAKVDHGQMGNLRNLVQDSIPKKGKTFQYYVMSSLRDSGIATKTEVNSFVAGVDNFSDNYFTKRLIETSEMVSFLVRKIEEDSGLPKISIDNNFVAGKWHPKNSKVKINIHAINAEQEVKFKAILEEFSAEASKIKSWSAVEVVRGPPTEGFVTIPKYKTRDSDFLAQLYSQSAFKQSGLDVQVTYNGNLKYNFLPTSKTTEVCDGGKFCHLAFFAPDDSTKNLLIKFDTNEKLLQLTGLNAREMFDEELEKLKKQIADNGTYEDYKAVIEVNKNVNLSDGSLARIRPSFDEDKGLIINVDFSAKGWRNPLAILEELTHLKQIIHTTGHYKSPIFWAEMSLNAEYGSAKSRHFNAMAEVDAMDSLENLFQSNFTQNEDVMSYISARRNHANKIVKTWKKATSAQKKFGKGVSARWKSLQTNLEKQNLKLDDYIASNNRKKVAELIDAYMPWEKMEPTEIAAWTRWIDNIEKPSTNQSDYMVTFRGLGGDLVKESDDGGHYLMAKLLTKNQGSYTRRLRSLKTYFKKKLGPKGRNKIPTSVQSLAAAFKGHSNEPMGSPYLSTSVLHIARGFSDDGDGGRIAAIKIDKSRNLINLVSSYGELEEMVPLIVFPDELIYLSDYAETTSSITDKVQGLIGRELKPSELTRSDIIERKLAATKEWWNMINPEGITSANATKTCKDVIKFFLQSR